MGLIAPNSAIGSRDEKKVTVCGLLEMLVQEVLRLLVKLK